MTVIVKHPRKYVNVSVLPSQEEWEKEVKTQSYLDGIALSPKAV